MWMQISSGKGPEECELAVGLFLKIIMKENPNTRIIDLVSGHHSGTYKSVLLSIDTGEYKDDTSNPNGTILWICLNLSIGLFVSKDISLGKAAQLAGKSLSEFINILNHLNIPAVEYTEDMYEDDLKFMSDHESERPSVCTNSDIQQDIHSLCCI